MNNELLPRPFCGDDEIMDFQAHLENRVQCAMCNVSTDTFPSCEESHAAWNTRTKAAPAQPQSDAVTTEQVEVVGYLNASTAEIVKYGPTVMDWDDEQEPVESLMTVAQHKRLMAAKDGDAVKVPMKLLERSVSLLCSYSSTLQDRSVVRANISELRALLGGEA